MVRTNQSSLYHRNEGILTFIVVMIVIQLKASELDDAQLDAEKKKLVEFWTAQNEIAITTLLVQRWDGESNGFTEKGVTETLLGDSYVYEELLGCR